MKLREIPGFPNYFASDDGQIYSTCYRSTKVNKPPKKLKFNIQSTGRYYIVNCKNVNGERKTVRVHRLVCLAFHGLPPNSSYTCSHLDGNWKNNRPENLYWETYSDNLNRKKEHGTDDIGVKNSRALIDLDTLKTIRRMLSEKITHQKIADTFNLDRLFITKIANGYRYKGQGF